MPRLVPHCRPMVNMTCGDCGKMLWDCGCFREPMCEHCGLSPEDGDAVNPNRCLASPDMAHSYIEGARER